MGLPGQERVRRRALRRDRQALFAQQLGEGDGAQADATVAEEPAARDLFRVLAVIQVSLTVHGTVLGSVGQVFNLTGRSG
jgi:hypothetical protein